MILKFFQGFGRWFGLDNPDKGIQATGSGSTSTDSGIDVSDEKAMQLSAVWSCVQIIVNSVASLGFDWYEVGSNGEREPLSTDHPLSLLFLGQPNRWMKIRDLRVALTLQRALWGNAYAKIDWIDDRPIAITPLHPGRMKVERGEEGMIYHYTTTDGVVAFAAKSIFHLKDMSVTGTTGLNRVDFARQTLGVAASANKYAAKQFANGGTPGGVLKLDKFLTKEQREHVKTIYEGISATAEGANKLWVLEGDMEYQNITSNPEVMQMIQSREFSLSEMARFFGVPGVLIGAGSTSSTAWPANFEQQVLSFLTFTLQSYVDEWEAECHYSLVPLKDRRKVICDHDEDDFVRMDSSAKALFLSTLAQNGLVTRNEGRKRLRLPTMEGADELTVQVNLTQLDQLIKVRDGANTPKPT